MKKILSIPVILAMMCQMGVYAQWGTAPAGWGDFYIGLTDDATKLPIITTAKAVPTGLDYRVRYINEGVDTLSNWYSHWPAGGLATNFINSSTAINMRAAFNIYMLQEDGGANLSITNMGNLDFMRRYFWNVRNVAQKANGKKVIFVIEPDTWGYLIQKNYGAGPTAAGGNPAIRPNLVFCNVNNLGYAHLAGLPNTMAGMAQGIIRTIRTFAPDAYVGLHTNHWAVWSNGATGAPCLGAAVPPGIFYQCQAGMPFWNTPDINVNADYQIAWYLELFGGAAACDKGDFLAVEKYGFDEGGRWIAFGAGASVLYYGNAQYQKWIAWCKRMGQGLNLSLLGWQTPVGNSGLPNTVQKYKDGFMQYFFANRQEFVCAGFIGLFMGPGVGASTFYTNGAGATGDDGWLFSNLRTQLDPARPINMNVGTQPVCAASAGTSCTLPVDWLSFEVQRANGWDYFNWQTVSEVNNNYFLIEKSTDGISFESIKKINGAHTSVLRNVYACTLKSPAAHYTYYRIRQVDVNGSFSFSRTIALENEMGLQVSVFPNPAKEVVHILLNAEELSAYEVNLFDLQGKALKEGLVKEDGFEISLENIPAGIYVLQITQAHSGSIQYQKIVVQ